MLLTALEDALLAAYKKTPRAADHARVVLDRDSVRPLAQRGDWEKPEQDAVAEVEDGLVKFRPLLRRYPFVTGVAVGSLR